jgi:cytochrome c-type biogenesis protein CcmE
MIFIGIVAIGMLASVGFLYKALSENVLYYHSPTQIADGEAPVDRRFRLGGLVVDGSVEQATGTLRRTFTVTDYAHEIDVEYTGVLPDLFAEGQGVVVHGTMNADGHFIADKVLAKHDENYMSPEVAESLAEGERRAAE